MVIKTSPNCNLFTCNRKLFALQSRALKALEMKVNCSRFVRPFSTTIIFTCMETFFMAPLRGEGQGERQEKTFPFSIFPFFLLEEVRKASATFLLLSRTMSENANSQRFRVRSDSKSMSLPHERLGESHARKAFSLTVSCTSSLLIAEFTRFICDFCSLPVLR